MTIARINRIAIVLLLLVVSDITAFAQSTNLSSSTSFNSVSTTHSASAASPASQSSTPRATGHNYFGFDLGLNYDWFTGNENFFWPMSVPAENIATFNQFTSLGSGLGLIVGTKGALALSNAVDLEAKIRFISNHSSSDETHTLPCPATPNDVTTKTEASNTYEVSTSSLDFALLMHLGITDDIYGIGGFSYSTLLSNRMSESQDIGNCFYIDNTTGTLTPFSKMFFTDQEMTDVFQSSRIDLQLGAGTIIPISDNSWSLDAELLLSVPLTDWLTTEVQNDITSEAAAIQAQSPAFPNLTPPPSFPKQWYASLTVGIRFPFGGSQAASESERESSSSSSTTAASQPAAIGSDGKVELTGRVTNAATGEPVDAQMTVVDLTSNEVVGNDRTDRDGRYSVRVLPPGKYSVTADADGYLFGTSYFEVDAQGRILSRHPDIKLNKATGGRTRLLVFFDHDKSELNRSSYPELDRAVRLMKAVPSMEVEIVGYTDNVGAADYNVGLSKRRAESVRAYLISKGVAKNRVTARGAGEESPIADNSTEDGRAENRRVEFVVTSK